ncbi:MAG: hypothetical protein HOD90_09655 [Nitrospina sp.]|nr:hypothetical protein [Nitrospina sp.]
MKTDIKNMVTPYFKFTDGIIQIKREDDQRSLENTKNKLRYFIPPPDPGFFQYGRNVVKMKRVENCIAINQYNY